MFAPEFHRCGQSWPTAHFQDIAGNHAMSQLGNSLVNRMDRFASDLAHANGEIEKLERIASATAIGIVFGCGLVLIEIGLHIAGII
jgi:hypothetical protein